MRWLLHEDWREGSWKDAAVLSWGLLRSWDGASKHGWYVRLMVPTLFMIEDLDPTGYGRKFYGRGCHVVILGHHWRPYLRAYTGIPHDWRASAHMELA